MTIDPRAGLGYVTSGGATGVFDTGTLEVAEEFPRPDGVVDWNLFTFAVDPSTGLLHIGSL